MHIEACFANSFIASVPSCLPPKPSGSPPPRPAVSLRDRIGERVPLVEPLAPSRVPIRPKRSPPPAMRSPPRERYRDISPPRRPPHGDWRDRDRDEEYYRSRSPPRDMFFRDRRERDRSLERRERDWDGPRREPPFGFERDRRRGRDHSPPRYPGINMPCH